MKENIRVSRLNSGLTILSDSMRGVRSATLGFFLRVGARNEPADLNGITHFIEHAVFKGTARRSALDIAIEQDRLGGTLDAFTTHEETGFVIKVIDDQIERGFDLIADMLTCPSFEEQDLENEQNVIIEEMKMVEDAPEDHLGEIFSEAFFPGHPLGRNIVGTPETVRSFAHERTSRFHRTAFDPSNLVIAAAGNVTHEQIEDLTAKYVSITAGSQGLSQGGGRSLVMGAPIVIRQNENLEQAHLIIAAPLVAATDQRRYPADLLATVVGGGTSSRLWQTVREERGLAYNVGASTVMYRDCGYFLMFAATSPDQVEELVDVAMEGLRDVVRNGISGDELELAKDQARAAILLSLEDSAARAGSLANSELTHGRVIPVEETLENIEAVTLEEVNSLVAEHFQTEKMAFAALGDLDGLVIDRDRLAL